jgi:hypothetical protein
MSDRSPPSKPEKPGTDTGLQKHVDRRSILRNAAASTAAVAGLTGVTSVSASDYAETLSGSNIDSYGDHDSWKHGYRDGSCGKAEVAMGSSIVESSATYSDDPAPVRCDWCVNTEDYAVIDPLEMTVSIENPDDGWIFSDAKKSVEEAPSPYGFEPSFRVSAGWMIFDFGYEFSSDGTEERIEYDNHEVSYKFKGICGDIGCENSGWLNVHLNNPGTSCDNVNCVVSVDVTADMTYSASGPGPCNDYETKTFDLHNTFEVKFDDDNC